MMQENTKTLPIKVFIGSNITPEERLFILLVGLIGLKIGRAFQLAFPTKANLTSCGVMASRLLQDRRIQLGLWRLAHLYYDKRLAFNEKVMKEDI